MGEKGSPARSGWESNRKYPRIPLAVRVEHREGGRTVTGRTGDIGLGGMLILSKETLEARAEVRIRFTLPAGHEVNVQGQVVHSTPGARMGIYFLLLSQDDLEAISEYVELIKPYKRRGDRVPRRLLVTLRWQGYQGFWHEEVAETVFLSRHGGTVLTPVRIKPGQSTYIRWPEVGREAEVRIVFSTLGGANSLSEIAFEFLNTDNFWGIDFPPHAPMWETKAL